MTTPMSNDKLLSLLAESLDDDRPPPDAIDAAYAAYGWRTLDADLAQLIEDSQVEVVGFREAAFSRIVAYRTEYGGIEVSIDGDHCQIDVDPAPTTLIARRTSGTSELDVDENGRATMAELSGPVRFEITWSTGRALTPWLTF